MTVSISSEILKIKINTFGAEISSITDYNDVEYLWQADEKVWKRHAPVLFPFICNTASKKYTYKGEEFSLDNHGFARDSEFEVLSVKENSAEFCLSYSEKSLKSYPFKFKLYVNYTVIGKEIKFTYRVENADEKEIYFFIGGHPAFRCPIRSDEDFSDYSVIYEKTEDIDQTALDGSLKVILENNNKLKLSHETFANDVILKDKPNSSFVAIVSKNFDHKIRLRFDNAGCIAVWSSYFADDKSRTENAKFVCLEPWSSTPVYMAENNETDIEKMSNAIKLEKNNVYKFAYSVEIG